MPGSKASKYGKNSKAPAVSSDSSYYYDDAESDSGSSGSDSEDSELYLPDSSVYVTRTRSGKPGIARKPKKDLLRDHGFDLLGQTFGIPSRADFETPCRRGGGRRATPKRRSGSRTASGFTPKAAVKTTPSPRARTENKPKSRKLIIELPDDEDEKPIRKVVVTPQSKRGSRANSSNESTLKKLFSRRRQSAKDDSEEEELFEVRTPPTVIKTAKNEPIEPRQPRHRSHPQPKSIYKTSSSPPLVSESVDHVVDDTSSISDTSSVSSNPPPQSQAPTAPNHSAAYPPQVAWPAGAFGPVPSSRNGYPAASAAVYYPVPSPLVPLGYGAQQIPQVQQVPQAPAVPETTQVVMPQPPVNLSSSGYAPEATTDIAKAQKHFQSVQHSAQAKENRENNVPDQQQDQQQNAVGSTPLSQRNGALTAASDSQVSRISQPSAPKHICAGCGRTRSVGYQITHPLAPGGVPPTAFCRRCVANATFTDSEGEDEPTSKEPNAHVNERATSLGSTEEERLIASGQYKHDKVSERHRPHDPRPRRNSILNAVMSCIEASNGYDLRSLSLSSAEVSNSRRSASGDGPKVQGKGSATPHRNPASAVPSTGTSTNNRSKSSIARAPGLTVELKDQGTDSAAPSQVVQSKETSEKASASNDRHGNHEKKKPSHSRRTSSLFNFNLSRRSSNSPMTPGKGKGKGKAPMMSPLAQSRVNNVSGGHGHKKTPSSVGSPDASKFQSRASSKSQADGKANNRQSGYRKPTVRNEASDATNQGVDAENEARSKAKSNESKSGSSARHNYGHPFGNPFGHPYQFHSENYAHFNSGHHNYDGSMPNRPARNEGPFWTWDHRGASQPRGRHPMPNNPFAYGSSQSMGSQNTSDDWERMQDRLEEVAEDMAEEELRRAGKQSGLFGGAWASHPSFKSSQPKKNPLTPSTISIETASTNEPRGNGNHGYVLVEDTEEEDEPEPEKVAKKLEYANSQDRFNKLRRRRNFHSSSAHSSLRSPRHRQSSSPAASTKGHANAKMGSGDPPASTTSGTSRNPYEDAGWARIGYMRDYETGKASTMSGSSASFVTARSSSSIKAHTGHSTSTGDSVPVLAERPQRRRVRRSGH